MEYRLKSQYTVFPNDPFDRLLSSEPSSKYRLTTVDDFFEYMYSLEVAESVRSVLHRNLQDFQELLEFTKCPSTELEEDLSSLQVISRKQSVDSEEELEKRIEELQRELKISQQDFARVQKLQAESVEAIERLMQENAQIR